MTNSMSDTTHDNPPPIGAAPEGQDFAHPWIISSIVTAISFGIGFAIMYATGLWANFWHWADGAFLFYFAIILPVLVGFTIYGMVITIKKMTSKTK